MKTNVKVQLSTPEELLQQVQPMTDEAIDKELNEILSEVKGDIKTTTDITGMKVTEVKGKGTKKPKAAKPATTPKDVTPKDVTPKTTTPKVDKPKAAITITPDATLVNSLTKDLPEIVTVKDIIGLFSNKFDGKFIRRHIRNKFIIGGIRKESDNNAAKYSWKKDDPQLAMVVTYFKGLAK